MLRTVEAGCILLLLAMFFAYVIAPAIDAVSRRVRLGRRWRPLSRPLSIVIVYVALFACGALAWHRAAPIVERWVHVTAPAVIDRVFTGDRRPAAVDRLYADVPLPGRAKQVTAQATMTLLAYVEGEVRAALGELVDAARYVRWLAVPPVIAFLLLAYAPGFRRSALRALPHGHLQWRGDEYLRDMASARQDGHGRVRWVEVCFCSTPLAEERPYWEEYFTLDKVQDAHARSRCRDENGTEPWACGDCDCSARLEARLAERGHSFLASLRKGA